jgi:hypothetical protein
MTEVESILDRHAPLKACPLLKHRKNRLPTDILEMINKKKI